MRTNIAVEEAVDIIMNSVAPLGTEEVTLLSALGRTLATDIVAPLDNPPFDRSPLDGYALKAADIAHASKETPATLTVVDTVYAGDVADIPVEAGQAVRIMTGAMLPPGCDCVIRQEDTNLGVPQVEMYGTQKPWDNYCYKGEDFSAGAVLIKAGQKIDAASIGVLASAGITEHIPVYPKPSVAVLATGDEVVDPDQKPLPGGKIYGSNAHLLWARLLELGMTQVHMAQIGDDPAAVAEELGKLCKDYDVVITTGGVSVGDKDIFHEALPMLGAERLFWRVQLKPGTPLMYSLYEGTPILSLSGNPFAAAATFELMGRPLLATMSSDPTLCMSTREGVLESGFGKKSKGRRYIRGTYRDGKVILPTDHSSGQLASHVGCNCLVDIPAGTGTLEVGDTVTVRLM